MAKVLSLRGGGMRGLATAVLLAELERQEGRACADIFDLIAGTSVGGIIATGLALKVPAKELVQFFEIEGPKIFKPRWLATVRSIFGGPRYDIAVLREKLADAFHPDSKLAHTYTKLMLCSLRYRGLESKLWKSWKQPEQPCVDVSVSSAAAPWYFGHVDLGGFAYCDGGLYGNNPVAFACLEAKKLFPNRVIHAIDIACPHDKSQFEPKRGSFLDLAPHFAEMFMSSGEDAMSYLARNIVGSGEVFSIEPPLLKASRDIGNASAANIAQLRRCAEYGMERNIENIRRVIGKHGRRC